MTAQSSAGMRANRRVPLRGIALGLAALVGFAAGALAFGAGGDNGTPTSESPGVAVALPPSGGVADISPEEWATIQRQVHDSFMDAYFATWSGGFPQALPVPPTGTGEVAQGHAPTVEEARLEHEALIDGVLAGAHD